MFLRPWRRTKYLGYFHVFLLIRIWRTKRHLKRNLATLEKRRRKLRCCVDAKFCKTNLDSSCNNTLSLSMYHVSTVMIIEHEELHGYSLRIQAINTKHHHLIHRGMQIVDRLIKTQSWRFEGKTKKTKNCTSLNNYWTKSDSKNNCTTCVHVELIRGSFVDLTEFRFDAVLPSTARQIDVYNTAARAVVMVNTFKTLTTTEVLQKHAWAQSKKLVLGSKKISTPRTSEIRYKHQQLRS